MKIALICPSNMLYMPYVFNYTEILEELSINYDIINWDRFNIEKQSEFIYRDSKIGHQRGVIDYFKYSKFVLNLLKNKNYNKIIIFGIQLTFFLNRFLIKKYRNKYIIDIRDYNGIIKYFNINKSIDNSAFTVLSSHGYKQWLPKINKYIINHNTIIKDLNELSEVNNYHISGEKISIGCVGALRDYNINIDLIESLKNNKFIQLNYHGEGDINRYISEYLIQNHIYNVNLTGRYSKEEEKALYNKNNIINVLRYNDSINNKTALPNRLYNSLIYGKVMLAFEGTYLSEIIKKYNLGLIIDTFNEIDKKLYDYLKVFNSDNYNKGRRTFIEDVIVDNRNFKLKIKSFLNEN